MTITFDTFLSNLVFYSKLSRNLQLVSIVFWTFCVDFYGFVPKLVSFLELYNRP
jgi:hypothetical protein